MEKIIVLFTTIKKGSEKKFGQLLRHNLFMTNLFESRVKIKVVED